MSNVNVFSYPPYLQQHTPQTDMDLIEKRMRTLREEYALLEQSKQYISGLSPQQAQPQQAQQQQTPQMIPGQNCYVFGELDAWLKFFDYEDRLQLTAEEFNKSFNEFYSLYLHDKQMKEQEKLQKFREKVAPKTQTGQQEKLL